MTQYKTAYYEPEGSEFEYANKEIGQMIDKILKANGNKKREIVEAVSELDANPIQSDQVSELDSFFAGQTSEQEALNEKLQAEAISEGYKTWFDENKNWNCQTPFGSVVFVETSSNIYFDLAKGVDGMSVQTGIAVLELN